MIEFNASIAYCFVLCLSALNVVATAQPPLYRSFPSNVGAAVDPKVVALRQAWHKAMDAWDREDFKSSDLLWQTCRRQAIDTFGEAHEVTREASAWIVRCESAKDWSEMDLRRFRTLDSFCRQSLSIQDADVNLAFVRKRASEWKKNLAIAESLFGTGSVDVANAYIGYSTCCEYVGDYRTAVSFSNSAATIFKSVLGNTHPVYATTVAELVTNLEYVGEFEEALGWIDIAEAAWNRVEDQTRPQLAMKRLRLGLSKANCLAEIRQCDEAHNVFAGLADELNAALGVHSDGALIVALQAANSFSMQPEQWDRAHEWLERANDIIARLGDSDSNFFQAQFHFVSGRLAINRGDFDRAERDFQKSNDLLSGSDQHTRRQAFATKSQLALAHAKVGRKVEATKNIDDAVKIMSVFEQEDRFSNYQPAARLACQTLRAMGRLDDAEKVAREGLKVYEERAGKDYFRNGELLLELALIRDGQGNFEESDALFQQAIALQTKTFGDKSKTLLPILRQYADMLGRAGQPAAADAVSQRIKAITP